MPDGDQPVRLIDAMADPGRQCHGRERPDERVDGRIRQGAGEGLGQEQDGAELKGA